MGDARDEHADDDDTAPDTPWEADDPVVSAQPAPRVPTDAPALGPSPCGSAGAEALAVVPDDAAASDHALVAAPATTPVSERSEEPDPGAVDATSDDEHEQDLDEEDAEDEPDDVDGADESQLVAASAPAPPGSSVSAWTIPLMCLGIGLIACCLLVPAADDNRRLAYEKAKLGRELEYVNEQVAVNDAFIRKLADDPTLAERLATRQMKMVREGAQVLELRGQPQEHLSPFLLVTVPPPEPLPEYQPVGGLLARLCRHPKTQLYTIGAGLLMVAVGLVLGANPVQDETGS